MLVDEKKEEGWTNLGNLKLFCSVNLCASAAQLEELNQKLKTLQQLQKKVPSISFLATTYNKDRAQSQHIQQQIGSHVWTLMLG